MKLNNWSTTTRNDNPYAAPEMNIICLQGTVSSHPRLDPEGEMSHKRIITSPIAKIEGRLITTKSGSQYELGTIDPEFRKYLKENIADWDYKNPIKSIKP